MFWNDIVYVTMDGAIDTDCSKGTNWLPITMISYEVDVGYMDVTIVNGIEWMLIIMLLWDTSIMLIHDLNEMNQLK